MAGGSLHDHYERPDAPLPSDRSTGLVLAAGLVLIGYLGRRNYYASEAAIDLGLLLAIISLSRPGLLRPLNIAWMKFAGLLSKIVNPIVMALLYAVVIVPAGLIRQLRSDPLRLKREQQARSYWRARDPRSDTAMERQF